MKLKEKEEKARWGSHLKTCTGEKGRATKSHNTTGVDSGRPTFRPEGEIRA